jgi:hypothetical protein
MVEPSGPLPCGWNDTVGVQWQIDTDASALAFDEWIDNVALTVQ